MRRGASASAGSLGSRNIPSSYSVAHAFRLGQARTRTNNLPVLTGLVFHARRPFGTHRSQPGTSRWHQRDPTSPAITPQGTVRSLYNFGAFDDSLWRYRIPTFEAIGTQKSKRQKSRNFRLSTHKYVLPYSPWLSSAVRIAHRVYSRSVYFISTLSMPTYSCF